MASFKDPQMLRAIIMQHYDQPSNKVDGVEQLKDYIHYHNKHASCIDDIDFYVKIKNNIVVDAKFFGVGCAISTASTDIICDLLKNQPMTFIDELLSNYFAMIKNEPYNETIMGELVAFCNIYQQPNRIACASIGAEALSAIKELNNEKK